MSKYDFALQWLDYRGVQVYNKGHRILTYSGNPKYEIAPLITKIKVGRELGEEDDEESFTRLSFLEFEKMGYIIKGYTDVKWKSYQKYAYAITAKKRESVGISYDAFRKTGIVIEHDARNRRFRLKGENVLAAKNLKKDAGVGDWIIYDQDRPSIVIRRKARQLSKDELRMLLQGNRFGGTTSEYEAEEQNIQEIPVMITDEKYIACIPKKKTECQRIIIIGESGFGKSVLTNGLAGRIFYSGDRLGWLIDVMNQFYDISIPQDYNLFIKILMLIGNDPRPIPALQLYMASKYKFKMDHPKISLRLTLGFEEFLRKYKFYTYGIKDYDVGATIRYLNDYINDIKKASTAKEIEEVMYQKIPNAEKDKGAKAMIYKWKNTFETIFKEKFTSNLYKDDDTATDELEVRFKEGEVLKGHPFIMAMEAGLVPVLNISYAKRQRWVRNLLADLMQKVITHQMERGDKKNRIWLIADELGEIYEKGKRKDNASMAFEELYRQGRFNNVGFIGNTQSLAKLEPEMYKNASYICSAYLRHGKDRKQLEDFQVDKDVWQQIGDLKEQEIMMFGSPRDPFIIYDRWGRRKVVTDRNWFRGRILPPINHHKVPGEKK